MLGFGEKKPKSAEKLRQKLFNHLKKGRFDAAQFDQFKGIDFDKCGISLFAHDYRIGRPLNGNSGWQVHADELFDMSTWLLTDSSALYCALVDDDVVNYGARDKDRVYMLTPTAYFLHKGNREAAKFIIESGIAEQATVDSMDAHAFRAPIYFCLRDVKMMELLLRHGAKATENVAQAAVHAMVSVNADSVKPLLLLIDHGVPAEKIIHEAKKIMTEPNLERLQTLLKMNTVVIVTPKAVPPTAPTAPVPHFVRIDQNYGDIQVAEIYDFRTEERTTFTVKPNGEKKADLHETFNQLGAKHKGLQAAIGIYRQNGGVFEMNAVSERSPPSALRIVPTV